MQFFNYKTIWGYLVENHIMLAFLIGMVYFIELIDNEKVASILHGWALLLLMISMLKTLFYVLKCFIENEKTAVIKPSEPKIIEC